MTSWGHPWIDLEHLREEITVQWEAGIKTLLLKNSKRQFLA
jgi:hypothetical protein